VEKSYFLILENNLEEEEKLLHHITTFCEPRSKPKKAEKYEEKETQSVNLSSSSLIIY
jgi:hypothetical protein